MVRKWCRYHHWGELLHLLPNTNVLVAFSKRIWPQAKLRWTTVHVYKLYEVGLSAE